MSNLSLKWKTITVICVVGITIPIPPAGVFSERRIPLLRDAERVLQTVETPDLKEWMSWLRAKESDRTASHRAIVSVRGEPSGNSSSIGEIAEESRGQLRVPNSIGACYSIGPP